MELKYKGPFATGVRVTAIEAVVKPGETVEVDDALGKSLLAQGDWEEVKAPRPARAEKTETED